VNRLHYNWTNCHTGGQITLIVT